MEVAIIGPRSRGATFVVHAAECADALRDQARLAQAHGSALWSFEAASRVAVVEEAYDGQLAENPDVAPAEWLGEFDFKPCCGLLPLEAPEAYRPAAPKLQECDCPLPALVRDDGTCSGCGAQVVAGAKGPSRASGTGGPGDD